VKQVTAQNRGDVRMQGIERIHLSTHAWQLQYLAKSDRDRIWITGDIIGREAQLYFKGMCLWIPVAELSKLIFDEWR
jgi:hypothetical protein